MSISEDVDVTIFFRHYIAEKTMSDESNPVGMMNEFAHGSWCSPRYEEAGATGPSHKPIFTVQVTYRNLRTWGKEKTKKWAKQEAAWNLISMIQRDKTNSYVDKNISSIEWDPYPEELSTRDVDRNTSAGDVPVDKDTALIRSSCSGIVT